MDNILLNNKKGSLSALFCFLLFSILTLQSCESSLEYVRFNGYTMGTTYQVTLRNDDLDLKKLKQEISEELEKINQLMSTYIQDSELSLFNRNKTTECQKLSKETLYVIKKAIQISNQTQGQFDVTLAPLIELWGFDQKQTNDRIPEKSEIKNLLKQVGYQNLVIESDCVRKKVSNISINLSAIAKGYAVDQIAKVIKKNRGIHYLIEIGGEVASQGVNPKGLAWKIAIESPVSQINAAQSNLIQNGRSIQKVIIPKGLGIATSGDYRNYFEKEGKRFSHMIDSVTGYPITHNLASVTVLHKETLLADALATAMMVMGKESALAYANANNLPIFMLVKEKQGFTEVYNQFFKGYIEN